MSDFEAAYAEWRALPFPVGSSDDRLAELHADIALADTWVAETLIPFVEQNIFEPAEVDVMNELGRLRARCVEMATVAIPGAALPSEYRSYVELLQRLYAGILERKSL